MSLYKHRTKSHIVRVLMICDEHTANTTDTSSGLLKQVVAQRQKLDKNHHFVFIDGKKTGVDGYVSDKTMPPFCMEETTFRQVYEELK